MSIVRKTNLTMVRLVRSLPERQKLNWRHTSIMRILLVEDDTMIGELVLDLLRTEHYAVDLAKMARWPIQR